MAMTGSVYTGVIGPETDYSIAWRSVIAMHRREGDEDPFFANSTKGYEARQGIINLFMQSSHDWLLLLDHDMVYWPDTLERLRSHNKTYVSGYYLRRHLERPFPVWYEYPDNPLEVAPKPWLSIPERGRLHQLGASGWGCILLHRSVIEDIRPLLYGEWEVLEDDMDVWPYDAAEVRCLIDELDEAVTCGNSTAGIIRQLKQKFRLLRPNGRKEPIGSDLRFPFFARQAGHILYGDPDVRPGHITYHPLTPWNYEGLPDDHKQQIADFVLPRWERDKEPL